MHPVLFEIFGVSVTAYGASKVLAALVAGLLLVHSSREPVTRQKDAAPELRSDSLSDVQAVAGT